MLNFWFCVSIVGTRVLVLQSMLKLLILEFLTAAAIRGGSTLVKENGDLQELEGLCRQLEPVVRALFERKTFSKQIELCIGPCLHHKIIISLKEKHVEEWTQNY